jgi:MFS family permease
MLLSSGLWNLAAAMTWPFYSLYVLELGGRHADIGFISALGAVTRIVPTLFGGYLADARARVVTTPLVVSVKLLDLMFLVAVVENRSLSESLSARIQSLEERIHRIEEQIELN